MSLQEKQILVDMLAAAAPGLEIAQHLPRHAAPNARRLIEDATVEHVNAPPINRPHQGAKERARRLRQMKKEPA